ncbi:MAG: hypothetical protein AB7R89_09300 [Dehalococcoidia bacterium]
MLDRFNTAAVRREQAQVEDDALDSAGDPDALLDLTTGTKTARCPQEDAIDRAREVGLMPAGQQDRTAQFDGERRRGWFAFHE